MSTQIRFHILKSASGQEYQLAINGTLLDGNHADGSSILASTDQLASVFTLDELSAMIERKKACDQYKHQHFVTNKELADWLQSKGGRRCVVVYPNQLIRDGLWYDVWRYTADTAECNAANGFEIYVAEAGSSSLNFLTRSIIGLA